jgi:hypothetical protein
MIIDRTLDYRVRKGDRKFLVGARFRLSGSAHAAWKLWRYGLSFPRALQPIKVPTAKVVRVIPNPRETVGPETTRSVRSYHQALASRGKVVGAPTFGSFVKVPVGELVKIRCCIAHWRDGVPWEETGIYEHMLGKIERTADPRLQQVSISDLRKRYARLDRVFATVKREGRLRHAHELGAVASEATGWNGIEIHVGAGGEPILGDSGTHRFAIAKVLELTHIPALLGFVHEEAVPKLSHFKP